jgi:putative endonuclease
MAGLGPAIHAAPAGALGRALSSAAPPLQLRPMRGGWVYIMTNRPNGTLYVGVTADIARRAFEHQEGLIEGFTRRYGLKRLVWMEFHDDIRAAIQREHNIKHWARAWKVRLIQDANREWRDLQDELNR